MKTILRLLLGIAVHLDLLLVLWLLARAIVARARRKPLPAGTVILCLLPVVVVECSPLGRCLVAGLEARFPRPGAFPEGLPEDLTGLILLGGGMDTGDSEARGGPVYNLSGARFFECLVLARRYAGARVVFTGNALEARLAAGVFAQHGIDARRVTLESGSRDTRENASKTLELVRPNPGERWALVTSAFHMPRAVGLFRRAGWQVTAYPVSYLTGGPAAGAWSHVLDGTNRLAWQAALHEWAGLAYQYLAGESSALYPGP